jgi:hypothetical protein
MDIKDITDSIMFGNLSNADITSVLEAVKFARGVLQRQTIRTLSPGAEVRFTSPKNGIRYEGRVERIAQKFVTVNAGAGGRWKVPANMLEVV